MAATKCACSAKSADKPTLPNIVIILADDMGYGDVQALNAESRIATPHLNRLAAEGMTFTDAHTPSAVCTPTRYGLLTGRYCWRSPLMRGVLNGYGKPLIEPSRPTIASLLKQSGYRCGIVGKWHLGLDFAMQADGESIDFEGEVKNGPGALGFDFSYIIPASLDFPPYVYIRDGQVTDPQVVAQGAQKFPAFLRQGPRAPDLVMEECLDHLLGQAVGFIRRQAEQEAEQPFLLYFPLTAPHKPTLPHPRFRGATELGPYGDFVAQVDWTVGEVLRALDESNVADNTLVIYTSDNGSYMYRRDDAESPDHTDDSSVQAYRSANHTANHVYRGTKADIWEAGHRVPFFVRWPGVVTPAARCHETICLTDVLATLTDIVGAAAPRDSAEDSYSFRSLLQGQTRVAARPAVIHHSVAGMFAIRDGRWKLVLGNGSGGREAPKGKPFERPFQLFDLSSDTSEQINVIEKHPEIAARLEAACAEIRGAATNK